VNQLFAMLNYNVGMENVCLKSKFVMENMIVNMKMKLMNQVVPQNQMFKSGFVATSQYLSIMTQDNFILTKVRSF
jgi:hypothetical protein